LKCQAPRPLPGRTGSPKIQTSSRLSTTAPTICLAKVPSFFHVLPFQRRARDFASEPSTKAQTLAAEEASAAATKSPFLPGNEEVFVQVDPLRRQAVGEFPWLNAHPPVLPTATIALKFGSPPLRVCLTRCQDGAAAVPADAEAPAAPVTATAAAMAAAAPSDARPRRCRRRADPDGARRLAGAAGPCSAVAVGADGPSSACPVTSFSC
jgi:hypothetical protein